MKKFVLEFLRRGFAVAGIGPIVLAIVYVILHQTAAINTLTVNQVCTGIWSLTALAIVAGGMNAIYQIERLPLMMAVLMHGGVLYLGYLGTYLLNDWLHLGVITIVVFTGIFIVGYIAIWAIIYSIIKRNTAEINERIRQNRQTANVNKG